MLRQTCLCYSGDQLASVHLPQWRTVYVHPSSLASLEEISLQYMVSDLRAWLQSFHNSQCLVPVRIGMYEEFANTKWPPMPSSGDKRLTFAVHLRCCELLELCYNHFSKDLLVIHDVGCRGALHPDSGDRGMPSCGPRCYNETQARSLRNAPHTQATSYDQEQDRAFVKLLCLAATVYTMEDLARNNQISCCYQEDAI